MKAYHSIEALAKDLQVSERTGWRWLDKGTVKRVRHEDGKVVFTLSADTDTHPTDVRGDGGKDRRESVRVESQEGIRLREPDNPGVREKSQQVDIMKLTIEGLEAENKIEELSQKRDEKNQSRDKYKKIQLVKEIIIPIELRKYLPPDILLVSLRLIDKTLIGVNLSLDECVALAQSVIWMGYWGGNPAIYRVVRPAIIQWTFTALEQSLKDSYAGAMVNGYEGSYNDFLTSIFLSMTEAQQMKVINFAYKGR